jgi:hypothetical protein
LPRPAATLLMSMAFVSAGLVAACEPTLQQQSGVVVDIDSPALGRVDSFELLTTDGERLLFDTTEMEFRSEFPAPHLAEHRLLGDRIVVTYKRDDERRVVTQLDDDS